MIWLVVWFAQSAAIGWQLRGIHNARKAHRMSMLIDCEDVPMHVELRHGGRRLPLEFCYSPAEHAYVVFLPDSSGEVWFAAELTAELAP